MDSISFAQEVLLGDAWLVIDANGNLKLANEGYIPQNGEVVLSVGDQAISVPEDLVKELKISQAQQNSSDQQIAKNLQDGEDPTQVEGAESAAGDESGSSLTATGAVQRDNAETIAQTTFDTEGFAGYQFTEEQESAVNQFFADANTILPPAEGSEPQDDKIVIPTAVDDLLETLEDQNVNLDLLDNDFVNLDDIEIVDISVPADQGTIHQNPDGSYYFKPAKDFNGEAEIEYTIKDGSGNEDSATAIVVVVPVNDAPSAIDDTAIIEKDTPIVIDVLENDKDIDGDDIKLEEVSLVDPSQGIVEIVDGKLKFTPAKDFTGEVKIIYVIKDEGGLESSADVVVTVVDTIATVAPTVAITEDTNNDGTIDRTEIDDKVDVKVTVPEGAQVGDTLKVSGQDDLTLTQDHLDNGVTYEYDRPADGQSLEVVATIVDQAGNESAEGSDSAVMGDTTATAAPTVVITEDSNNDGTIDRTEIDGKVDVKVTVPVGAQVGDILKVSGQDDVTLTQDHLDNGVTYEYDRPADGETLTATATIVDQAGNESAEGSDSAIMGDTTATAAPTVVITEDTNNDGTIDRTEISGKVDVKVTVPVGAQVGDILKVSGQDDVTLTQDHLDNGVTYEYDRPDDGQSLEVVATIVDQAGNESAEGSDSAVMGDTTATAAPTVVITEDSNNDGTIDRTEIDGKVDVTVTVPVGAQVGDILKVSGQDDVTLTQDHLDNGVTYEYDRPADGETLTVTATIVDQAGNESAPGSDSAVMGDTTATAAPTVVITEDSNNDGTIDRTEISGKVDVTVTVPEGARVGDTLKVSGQDDVTLTQDHLDNGVTYEYDRPADGQSLEVVATIVDQAGNESAEGSDSAIMGDTTATATPTVVITEDSNNDGTIDRTEISGKVDVTVTVPVGAQVGDILKVSGQDDVTLTQDHLDNGVTYEYDRPADGQSLEVVATIVDQAGNESAEGSDSAIMGDTTATATPTVVITEDSNNDGTIDRTEISGKVDVKVTVPVGAQVGDILKVSGQDDVTLTQDHLDNGVTYEYDRPADGESLEVVATIVDQAGNESAEGSDSAVMGDTTATAAPTVVITEDTNNDGTIVRTEIDGKVDVKVTVPEGAQVGDTLKVSGQDDVTLTQDHLDNGVTYEYDRPADGQSLEVVATIVDQAGNESAEGSDSAVMGDTTATAAPTVVITEDTNNDGTIDRTEISGKVDVKVTVPVGAQVGDTLKVSGQDDVTLTQDHLDNGVTYEYDRPADGETLTVTATIVDQAGNESAPGSDSAVMGDTTATAAPTVVIIEDMNNDGTIDRTEVDGKVDVKVTVPVGAQVGDILKVSGQDDVTLTQDYLDNGVTYEYDRPADGETLTVTATIVDQAGNESAPGSDSAVMGDTTATAAPTVVIIEDMNNDGTIDRTEVDGKVDVKVTVPVGAQVGDILKVSGQDDVTLTQDHLDNGVTYEYDRPVDGESLEVVATIVDQAGNESAEGSDRAVMGDTTATAAPTVVITEDTNNDGTIDRTE
ncbi:Ig-like domain-containing protein, partial [Vibrio comitans]|uniref:Ig-like domain-containing protein n=1 Tax=Vibrio comitans TaxID=413401 RepID=UPI0035E6EEA9